MADGAL
ncbi:unnamed protein product, partial [Rotaria sordida]